MPITRYDPLVPPVPQAWLDLDERARIELVEAYHRDAGIPLPNVGLHAALQSIVETQIAMQDETPIARTVLRLVAEGLDRHEALHCVGKALVESMNEAGQSEIDTDINDIYFRKVASLTAVNCLRDGEIDPPPARPRSRRARRRRLFRA